MTEVKRKRRRAAPAGIAPSEPERDILDQYLYEVSTYPLLKGTEEIELARKIRAGDPDALQELVKRNLRFVISVAKKYQNRGLPLIDLIGEGNVGLLTAARKFDPDQGVKFISYAVWWIRQAILSSLARQGRTVRVPLNRTADLSRIIKASEILRQKLRREPSPEELSQLTGLSVDVVQSLAALNTGDVRLDAPMDPEGDRSLIERFVADEMPDTEEEAMNRFLTDEIEQALGTLPPRDAKVLRLYFGLEGARGDRLDARRHARARPSAARPRAQAAARGRRGSRAGQLRRLAVPGLCREGGGRCSRIVPRSRSRRLVGLRSTALARLLGGPRRRCGGADSCPVLGSLTRRPRRARSTERSTGFRRLRLARSAAPLLRVSCRGPGRAPGGGRRRARFPLSVAPAAKLIPHTGMPRPLSPSDPG
jgi:RNA polymerase primary sigma factor